MHRRAFIFALIAVAYLGIASAMARAEVTKIESENSDQPTTYRMTVTAAAEPTPALKYRFLVPRVDQIDGNAALYYYKSMVFESPDYIRELSSNALAEDVDRWTEMPLDQLPKDEITKRVLLLNDPTWLQPLEDATRCNHCMWGDPIRQYGMNTLLPQAQKMRSVARGLALKAHLQLAAGQADGAIDTLRTGFVLARNMGHGPTLVHSLIGIAIQGHLNEQTRTLIALKDSPNLYWALSELASKPVDMREGMSYETRFWDFTVPGLADLDRRIFSADEALRLAKKMLEVARGFSNINLGGTMEQEEILALALYFYPEARGYLLERGVEASRIEAMPIIQTVLLAWWKQYELVHDDTFKWLLLPDDEARQNVSKMTEDLRSAEQRGEGSIFTKALPAIQATIHARIRSQREIDLLRAVEALRLYAAKHGHWPERLEDITEVPVPRDVWSQKPFEYSVKEGVASLQLPAEPKTPGGLSVTSRYELSLRTTEKTK